ncbi:MAG: MFS transporter [Spirochaetales bacterium]|nr:MFS transporter [Spirochaetales bacterium]
MKKLTMKTKLAYGICDLGGNLFFTVMGFYLLNFLTDKVLLGATLAGIALLIGKLWDAVSDPLVGYFSDRTNHKLGRRRPYILWGSISCFVFMILMFTKPPFTGQAALFLWAALMFCLINTAYTLINIPYSALTPDLTDDYQERTVLNGFRMSFAVAGTFVGAGIVLPLVDFAGWTGTGAVLGFIIMITALVTVIGIKEKPFSGSRDKSRFLRTSLKALKSPVFRKALIPWTCHIAGITIIQSSLIYFYKYIHHAEDKFQLALVFLLGSSLVFIVVWVKISEKIGKKLSYNIGMGIFAAAVLLFFLIGAKSLLLSYVCMAIAGIGLATQYVMPYSIIPDIVDYDHVTTNERKEGVFYGIWMFASKLGQAFALFLSGRILDIFGYVPDTPQSASSILGIRLLAGPIPVFFFAAGIAVLSFYPISKQKYLEIREKRLSMEKAGD